MKRVLIGLSALLLTVTLAIGGTTALFSDIETSSENTFTAGAIDLTLANQSYYNGEPSQETSWRLTNLDDQLFFNFLDVKPGDWGENTISIQVENNESWLCLDGTLIANNENGINEPERKAGDASTTTGELGNFIHFIYWADDGDNVYEDDEGVATTSIFQLSATSTPLADVLLNLWGGSSTPFAPNEVAHLGLGWCFGNTGNVASSTVVQDGVSDGSINNPTIDPGFICDGSSVTNISQTDSLEFSLTFSAVQSRHNNSFTCTGEEVVALPSAVIESIDGHLFVEGENIPLTVPGLPWTVFIDGYVEYAGPLSDVELSATDNDVLIYGPVPLVDNPGFTPQGNYSIPWLIQSGGVHVIQVIAELLNL